MIASRSAFFGSVAAHSHALSNVQAVVLHAAVVDAATLKMCRAVKAVQEQIGKWEDALENKSPPRMKVAPARAPYRAAQLYTISQVPRLLI